MAKAEADAQATLKQDPALAKRFAGYGLTVKGPTVATAERRASK